MSTHNFKSVQQNSDERWVPTKEADGKTPRTVATKDDFRIGWYSSNKQLPSKKPGETFTVHTFEKEDGTTFDLAGGVMINDILGKLDIGSFIKITWLGLKPAKKAGGDPYHTWDIAVDTENSRKPSFNPLDNSIPAGSLPAKSESEDLPF